MDKVMSMKEAIKQYVKPGDTVYLAGFTHLIPFAAAHEIIRQGIKDLTLCRATPDLIYDQMIAAGCAKKIIFSWAGNPGVGSLYALRRAVEQGIPNKLEIEEYSHFGTLGRLFAGAAKLPFFPLRSYKGSTLPEHNRSLKTVRCPYTGEEIYVVPALNPDAAIIGGQRADAKGNVQIWGILGEQKEAAFASKRVIAVVEEIVGESIIRSDPNRTAVPDIKVDAVVEEPWAFHPSYAQGYYDRDNDSYLEWAKVSKTHESLLKYLDEWVYGLEGRREYIEKLGLKRLLKLKTKAAYATPVNYGLYQ